MEVRVIIIQNKIGKCTSSLAYLNDQRQHFTFSSTLKLFSFAVFIYFFFFFWGGGGSSTNSSQSLWIVKGARVDKTIKYKSFY